MPDPIISLALYDIDRGNTGGDFCGKKTNASFGRVRSAKTLIKGGIRHQWIKLFLRNYTKPDPPPIICFEKDFTSCKASLKFNYSLNAHYILTELIHGSLYAWMSACASMAKIPYVDARRRMFQEGTLIQARGLLTAGLNRTTGHVAVHRANEGKSTITFFIISVVNVDITPSLPS